MAKKPLHSELLKRLEPKTDKKKGPKTLYFDLGVYDAFSDWCKRQTPKTSPSKALEEFMRMVLESAEEGN